MKGSNPMGTKKFSRREFLSMAAVTTAGIGLAACQPTASAPAAAEGNATEAEVQSTPSEADVINITFMGWGGPEESQGVQDLIKRFEADNPTIKVTWQHTPEDYNTKLMAMIASGTPPDTLFLPHDLYKDFCSKDLLLDIQDQLASDSKIDTKTYFLQPQEDSRSAYHGRWHGIGCCWVGTHLFYNADMFKEAGIEPPSCDPDQAWTWDHFVEVAKQLTVDSQGRHPDDSGFDKEDIQQWGISWSSGGWHAQSITLLNGVQALDEATNQYKLDDPLAIEALQNVADLMFKYHVNPLATNFKDLGMSFDQMLENRKLAMAIDGTYTLSWTTKIKATLGVACPPKMKQTASAMTADVRSAMKATKYPDAAYKWVRMTADPEYQSTFLKMGLWWPNQTALMTPEGLDGWITERKGPGDGVHPDGYKTLVDKFVRNNTKSIVCPPGYPEASQMMDSALENLWNGTQTAQQAVDSFIGKANEVLAKAAAA
jgi:multiple sugar transport system substrate-binding protein